MHVLIRTLAGARFFAFLLPWLMAILIIGTIAEKTLGLYQAWQMFFSSWIIWVGGIFPLPGQMTLALLIFLGLLCKLATDRWDWRNLGTITAHIGVVTLLLGGFVTALSSNEGAMAIPVGGSQDYIEDYHRVEFSIIDVTGEIQRAVAVIPESLLKKGKIIAGPDLPFEIEILSWCRNCSLVRLGQHEKKDKTYGVASNFALKRLPRDPLEEKNVSGLTFRVSKIANGDGIYAVFESMPIPEIITANGRKYLLSIGKVRTYLPFSIQMISFHKDLYPGTDKPRAFQSEVAVNEGDIVWRSPIGMNEPLRYKGYTFYQSSFIEEGDNTLSVLAVVNNTGRIFPYLSGLIIAVGLMIHLVQLVYRRKRIKPI